MHGCFESMIRMFVGDKASTIEAIGFPGSIVDNRRNVYLFNGDFVDRGGSGYQIVLMLALLHLLNPETTLLNRGNHESEMFGFNPQDGMGYKFLNEIKDKFPNRSV